MSELITVLGQTRKPVSALRRNLKLSFPLDDTPGVQRDLVSGLLATPTATNGVLLPVNSPSGYGVDFATARTQDLVVPANPTFNLPAGGKTFTVCIWAQARSFVASSGMVCKCGVNGSTPEWFLIYNSGTVFRSRYYASSVVSIDSPAGQVLVTGQWYPVRFWADYITNPASPTWNLQVGQTGTVVSAAIATTFTPSNQAIHIGRFSSSWDGYLANFEYREALLSTASWVKWCSQGPGGQGSRFPHVTSSRIRIVSPVPYRVYQRNAFGNGLGTAGIVVRGTYSGAPAGVEARWNGGSWQTIDAAPANGRFSGTLTGQPVGQGLLEVRFTDQTGVTASIANVGVGDVVLVSGQSNASGRGTNNQPVSGAFTATMLGNDFVFKPLADPWDSSTGSLQQVANDAMSNQGSWGPLLGTLWMADQGCPVMFVPAPLGATAISQWQPGTDRLIQAGTNGLYGAMNVKGQVAGPFLVNLWWQGEQDAFLSTSQATYTNSYRTLVDAIATDIGCKTMACRLQQNLDSSGAAQNAIRNAVDAVVAEAGNAVAGPDFSDMAPDDSNHFKTDAKLLIAAQRWLAAVKAWKGA